MVALLPLLANLLALEFPARHWRTGEPAQLAMNPAALDEIAARLGGRGCIIKDGFVVRSWGDQGEVSDWLSSAKPVLSTLLFFAIQEGRISGVDAPVSAYWNFKGKDQAITFRHLANMISGYARPDAPGAAWAYNDYAINLYQKSLFDHVLREDPDRAAAARFAPLGLEDGLRFRPTNRRLSASTRDFARIAWFWLNKGKWNGKQILRRRFFDEYMRPHVPPDVPHTAKAPTDDYLSIGTYGGGSDHFTEFGAGIYGFNWWFNATGRLHPGARTWPDAPPETIMSIGAGGNCTVLIPSRRLVLACARGNWGKHEPGVAASPTNQIIRLLMQSLRRT